MKALIHQGRGEKVLEDPMLLKTVQSGKIDHKLLITHRFKLERILEAYDTFGLAASTRGLKVIIEG